MVVPVVGVVEIGLPATGGAVPITPVDVDPGLTAVGIVVVVVVVVVGGGAPVVVVGALPPPAGVVFVARTCVGVNVGFPVLAAPVTVVSPKTQAVTLPGVGLYVMAPAWL